MKTYIVVFQSGGYSDTRMVVLRSFSDPDEADTFAAECARIYREAQGSPLGKPPRGWKHPLTPQLDDYDSDPDWSVEDVEHDGLWRALAGGWR